MPLRTHYLELLLSDGAGSQQGSHTHSSTNGGGATGPSRRIDLTSLDAAVQGYFHKGLAPSTHRTYDAAMRRFSKFCVLYDIYDPFMCYFATSLANDGLPTQTIKCYLSAVRSMQISLGLPPPSEHSSLPVLKRVLDGIRRCKVLGGETTKDTPPDNYHLRLKTLRNRKVFNLCYHRATAYRSSAGVAGDNDSRIN